MLKKSFLQFFLPNFWHIYLMISNWGMLDLLEGSAKFWRTLCQIFGKNVLKTHLLAYFGYPNPYLSYPISHYLLWYCKVALMDWDLYVFNRLNNVFKTFYAISVIIWKNCNLRKLQCLPERLKSMVFGEKKFYFLKTNHIFKSDTAFHSNKIFRSTAFSKKIDL